MGLMYLHREKLTIQNKFAWSVQFFAESLAGDKKAATETNFFSHFANFAQLFSNEKFQILLTVPYSAV